MINQYDLKDFGITQATNDLIKQLDLQRNPPTTVTEICATQKQQGLKYDQDKPRMDLLDPEFLEGVAKVLSFGANKYDAHNWRLGIPLSRLLAAAYRHLGQYNSGADLDKESGLNHLYHASCCLMFASWLQIHRPAFDDRWREAPIRGISK